MHKFSEPREVVLQIGLREGMKVGDLGAGSGHYTRAAAAAVGTSGRVYAVDVQEDVLKHLKLNTHEYHQGAIETIWGNLEKPGGTHLRDSLLDVVILANVFFQIEHTGILMNEVNRILKPGGSVLVVDWSGSYGGVGPAPEHVRTEDSVTALFEKEGFNKSKSVHAGSHHWGAIFTKA